MVWLGCLLVFNAIFNKISAISRRSVLLVEETGRPGEIHRPVASGQKTKDKKDKQWSTKHYTEN